MLRRPASARGVKRQFTEADVAASDVPYDGDFGTWPTVFAQRYVDSGMAHTYLRLLGYGVYAVSDYSGMDSYIAEKMKIDVPNLNFARACDLGKAPQRVLVDMSVAEGGYKCVFDSMSDRLPSEFAELLKVVGPGSSKDAAKLSKEEATARNQEVYSVLERGRDWAMPPEATSKCLVHPGQKCPVHVKYVLKGMAELDGGSRLKFTPWWAKYVKGPVKVRKLLPTPKARFSKPGTSLRRSRMSTSMELTSRYPCAFTSQGNHV